MGAKYYITCDRINISSWFSSNFQHYSRSSSTPRDRSTTEEELRRQVSHLKAKVIELTKQAEPLRRTLAKSEDRNKQLVDVTQQWAIECQEKENQIAVRDSQIRELRGEIDPQKQRLLSLENRIKELTSEREQLKKRVSKLKKQLSSASERCREERVGDSQFEELRVELSHRRELYDQVLQCRITVEPLSLKRHPCNKDTSVIRTLAMTQNLLYIYP